MRLRRLLYLLPLLVTTASTPVISALEAWRYYGRRVLVLDPSTFALLEAAHRKCSGVSKVSPWNRLGADFSATRSGDAARFSL
jgi:hypothetical protein